MPTRFITLAIHTYEKAVALRSLLESEGIQVEFRNVNIEHPIVSSGVRVRIREIDLPLALRIIENREIFAPHSQSAEQANPTKPILVPIDFSDVSFKAAVSAFSVAHAHATSIVLLHTYIDPYVAGSMQLTDSLTYEINDIDSRRKIESMAGTQMRHFANRLRNLIKQGVLPPVKFTTTVVEGVPEDAITEYCRANAPFIIVMGTRCPKKKEIDMIGSVTAEVLDKCRFTVLAIPEDNDPDADSHIESDTEPHTESQAGSLDISTPLTNVLYFCNNDQQDILALDTLHRIFPSNGTKVVLADLPSKKRPFMRNTADSIKAILEYCNQNFEGYEFRIETINAEDTEADIRRLASATEFDLIVVPNKKKNILSRLFNPTIAHRILFSSSKPLLVIPV